MTPIETSTKAKSVPMFESLGEGAYVEEAGRDSDENSCDPGGEGRGAEALDGRGEGSGQQAVARHGEPDARLAAAGRRGSTRSCR